jgi:hypothetical protein
MKADGEQAAAVALLTCDNVELSDSRIGLQEYSPEATHPPRRTSVGSSWPFST